MVSGTTITDAAFDGEAVTFFANSTFYPYFDHGNAGLGVCQNVANPGATASGGTGNMCTSGSADDNVTVTEAVTIAWQGARTLSNLLFSKEGHTLFASTNTQTLLFGINGGSLARYTFGELMGLTFNGVTSATFGFDDASFDPVIGRGLARNNEQFYLAAATISPVPLPASLPLMLAGMVGLGWFGRRRKSS
ncbi:VPLPA-CTERM sorting domain-containing protein [Maliponia aquimaris]|uniref:VPLPA-CTERM sorting domain-containing protein n=1 Tax=Maliponia aquimaris TaxID=1673631 RepID=UPI001595B971|nr:VPLPA-CTERM sorting domain-containing protein [Maliponia aquimaris]